MFWEVRLTEPARQDFADILHYTLNQFGEGQAAIYEERIIGAMEKLEEGPHIPGSILRNTLLDLYTLHITLGRKGGRHFLLYRSVGSTTIDVLRILHDASDIHRHVSDWDDD